MNSDFIKLKRFRRQFHAMNAKAKVKYYKVMLGALLCAVGAILIIFGGVVWWAQYEHSQHRHIMRTEELKITSVSWAAGNTNATITLKNSGTSSLTIDTLKINSVAGELYRWRTVGGTWAALPAIGLTFEPGQVYEVCVRRSGGTAFTPGTKYEFVFHTAAGNNYPYTDYAP